jgi:hypothetical protein
MLSGSATVRPESCWHEFEPHTDRVERPLPPARKRNRAGKRRRKKNGHPNQGFDLRMEACKLFGVDVIQKWPTAAYLVSWPALSPDSDISCGTLLWRGVRTVKNRTAISPG